MNTITLCFSCERKAAEGYLLRNIPSDAPFGRCDHCKRKTLVKRFEVLKPNRRK